MTTDDLSDTTQGMDHKCLECGQPLDAAAGFCSACGTKVMADIPPEPVVTEIAPPKEIGDKCPHCNQPMAKWEKFCGDCGKKVERIKKMPPIPAKVAIPTPEVNAPTAPLQASPDLPIVETGSPQIEAEKEADSHKVVAAQKKFEAYKGALSNSGMLVDDFSQPDEIQYNDRRTDILKRAAGRSIVHCAAWSILTLGVYTLFWLYRLVEELNAIDSVPRNKSKMVIIPAMVTVIAVFLRALGEWMFGAAETGSATESLFGWVSIGGHYLFAIGYILLLIVILNCLFQSRLSCRVQQLVCRPNGDMAYILILGVICAPALLAYFSLIVAGSAVFQLVSWLYLIVCLMLVSDANSQVAHQILLKSKGHEGITSVELQAQVAQIGIANAKNVATVLCGFASAVICAFLWGGITSSLGGMQVGWLAWGAGAIVGLTVKSIAGRLSKPLGLLALALSALAIMYGHGVYASILWSNEGILPLWQTLGHFGVYDVHFTVMLLWETLNPISLVFYGLAMFTGWRIAYGSDRN